MSGNQNYHDKLNNILEDPIFFTWVNTMISNVKNAMHGSYHSISANHLPRYLAEFCYRFNRRFFPVID
jgi:hypothetical protein